MSKRNGLRPPDDEQVSVMVYIEKRSRFIVAFGRPLPAAAG
jgi:hypothetical protein